MKNKFLALSIIFCFCCSQQIWSQNTTNTSYGVFALANNTTGLYNSAFGRLALQQNTSGNYNTGVGENAMNTNTTGSNNTSVGRLSLYYNITGNYNTAIGYQSMFNNQASNNSAFGSLALYSNTTGTNLSASGYQALYSNTTGDNNAAFGYRALYSNTDGFNNVAFGNLSLSNNSYGLYNSALGYQSLGANTTGGNNTAVGNLALAGNTEGYLNAAFGNGALSIATTAYSNTACGSKALGTATTGGGNTGIGADADVTSGSISNATALGYGVKVNASNKVVIGNTSVTVIGGQVGWSTFSDGRFKKNIQQNVPGLEFINRLNPVTYNVEIEKFEKFLGRKDSDLQTRKTEMAKKEEVVHTGFIAQEVEKTAKEIGYTFSGVHQPENEKDNYSIAYSDFVPSLVKAVQELSKQVQQQHEQNKQLQKDLNELKSIIKSVNGSSTSILLSDRGSIEQNAPNPFTSSTTIKYKLPQQYSHAQVLITDMGGRTVKTVRVAGSDYGVVQVTAGSLAAGAYQYALIIDGKIVDTKTMVLTK